jgi:hypothetical protein
MNGVGAGRFGRGDDVVDHKVALICRRRTDVISLIGDADMESGAVAVGEDGDRDDIALLAGADDPDGDFAPVGDQDLLDRFDDVLLRCFHNGMFPCFLGGLVSFLLLSISKARIRRGRVLFGSITSSTYPRAAATNGLANISRNSSVFF